MAEQASPYRSMPGTPVGSGGEKKKKGIKKIISGFTKKHDPTPEVEGFEPATNENGERVHFRDKISSFFKGGSKDGESPPSEPIHPLKELLDQEFKAETEKEETKPGMHDQSDVQDDDTNKHNFVKKAEEAIDSLIHRKRHVQSPAVTEYSKIEKPNPSQDDDTNKHNFVKKAEEAIDSLIHRKRHVHAPAVTEDSKLEKTNPSQDVVEPKPTERVEEEQIPHDHSKINTDSEVVATEEAKTGPTSSAPPSLPAPENEAFGCGTLAKGVQKICMPWTLNKDQD